MVNPTAAAKQKKALDIGCSCLGWFFFLAIFIGTLVLGYRVWFYADKLRRGEIVDLPSFTSKLTVAGGDAVISSIYVEPAIVEGLDQPTLGNEIDPKLTIVEFGDFQCPYCREVSTTVRSLMSKYAGQVRFIYRDYPVESLHPLAMQASLAAECAREQRKFWPYHDKLYANQSSLSLAEMLSLGEEIGLESGQFEQCVVSNRYQGLVDTDLETAKSIGIRGTPTFFFNGQRIEGVIPEDIFEQLIRKMIQ